MNRRYIAIELDGGITLTIPEDPMTDDVLKALLLLGGMLYHGLIKVDPNKAKWEKAVDECFDRIKKGDFSELAKGRRRCVILGEQVYMA